MSTWLHNQRLPLLQGLTITIMFINLMFEQMQICIVCLERVSFASKS